MEWKILNKIEQKLFQIHLTINTQTQGQISFFFQLKLPLWKTQTTPANIAFNLFILDWLISIIFFSYQPELLLTIIFSKLLVPELVGGIVGVYNGKEFVNVEVKFDMIGKYLAEFAMTYKPTSHGKSGVAAGKGAAAPAKWKKPPLINFISSNANF